MTTALSSELYDELTARTFYVVDTEFSTDEEGEHHLIAIAIVPVVGGHRAKTGDELYRVMNPGVPIDVASGHIHGFTDADVARKRTFGHFAGVIVERLSEDDAVFVCHTTIDAHVLGQEFERLQERDGVVKTKAARAALPNLPVLDTQRLASIVGYPGVTKGSKISLDRLCDVTGVPRTEKAHDAHDDARATANALIELLHYTADRRVFWTFDNLLDAASGGTTHEPRGPAHIRSNTPPPSALPPEHIARHIYPLSDPVAAGSAEAERWLDLAAECAQLRCPYLRDEAKVAAAANGAVLLRPLMDDLAHMLEPGQAGALVGAVLELLAGSDPATPTLPPRSALKWWTTARPAIAQSPPCDRSAPDMACPSCQEGDPCPRDVVFLPLAEAVTVGAGVMDKDRVRDLLAPKQKSPLNTWRTSHPDVLAYALWRIAGFFFEEGHDEAAFTAVDQGIALNLHAIEPRLAELACERLVEIGEPDKAFDAARAVLAHRTSDPAYDDLADWVLFTQNALYEQQPMPHKPITHPRRARPEGLTNPRLYS